MKRLQMAAGNLWLCCNADSGPPRMFAQIIRAAGPSLINLGGLVTFGSDHVFRVSIGIQVCRARHF
jgi:hypothetical protein